jgi:2-phosphoglycerate kinase
VLQADELRMALQRVTTAASHRALHRFLDPRADVWREAGDYSTALYDVAAIVSSALEPIIEHRVEQPRTTDSLIIEGDGILPSLVGHRPGVRAVVVTESDRSRLRARLARRGRGFETLSTEAQATAVEGSALFGVLLAEAARRVNVPVVEASPLTTLADRLFRTMIGP